MNVNWISFKNFVDNKKLSIQWYDDGHTYIMKAIDGLFVLDCFLNKNIQNEDLIDFETNYKNNGNRKIVPVDSDTGGTLLTPKFSPDGWHQQYFETEFETSNSSENSIHEKDWLNNNLGFSSLKFYKVVDNEEVECENQEDIDNNCIRTDLLWMPPFDYAIKSGYVSQKNVPSDNVYVWVVAVDLDIEYGGPQVVFAEGGINLTYVDSKIKAGLDGVSATVLSYSHPILGEGIGTNRLRFIVRHPAGFKHRIQAVFEIFVE